MRSTKSTGPAGCRKGKNNIVRLRYAPHLVGSPGIDDARDAINIIVNENPHHRSTSQKSGKRRHRSRSRDSNKRHATRIHRLLSEDANGNKLRGQRSTNQQEMTTHHTGNLNEEDESTHYIRRKQ